MGTRSGNIDPAIMEFIAEKNDLDIAGVMDVLNKKSGVFGIIGRTHQAISVISEQMR